MYAKDANVQKKVYILPIPGTTRVLVLKKIIRCRDLIIPMTKRAISTRTTGNVIDYFDRNLSLWHKFSKCQTISTVVVTRYFSTEPKHKM